ncbi:MAG: hypothetical protein IKJ27_08710 [Clostridia bacterium]|nr:hypothetical protein [Clostridia bacterium]
MLEIFSRMISYALFALLIQTTVFGGIGIDEGVKAAKKPRYLFMYGFWVSFFSLSLSVTARLASPLLEKIKPWSASQDFLCYTLMLIFIYIAAALFCRYILHANRKYMNSLGFCAFNSLVMSMPAINGGSLVSAVGTALGAGAAFTLSVLIIRGGMKHINLNRHIPEIFRGTPALYIYISLIALALSCVSGGTVFI